MFTLESNSSYQFLTKGLSWKRREVCSLLQDAETQDVSSLLSYPRPTLNCMFKDLLTWSELLAREMKVGNQ